MYRKTEQKKNKYSIRFGLLLSAGLLLGMTVQGGGLKGQETERMDQAESFRSVCQVIAAGESSVLQQYQEYTKRFEEIVREEDIEASGFRILRGQRFPVYLGQFGEVMFTPAMEEYYHRLALFFVDADGEIVYKTDQLETNYRIRGSVMQSTTGLSAVSFQDVNGDDLWDIVLITSCEKKTGEGAGRTYRVGDVLFQGEKCFYRDWRVSDKINRFSMNKSIEFIAAFVRDGHSTEFMYTASTMDELLQSGLNVVSEQCYWRSFEKLGRLLVVPGTYRMSDYDVFMIFLVNEDGNIVWSFQPMGEYDNLYALKGVGCRDIDGDGLKDIVVLARYNNGWDGTQMRTETDYAVYYQRTSGFVEDTELKDYYVCEENVTMTELVKQTRAYWGWSAEDD